MRSSTLIGVLAVVVIVPVAIFAVWTALSEVTQMLNPCISWGMGNFASGAVIPASGGPCATGVGGTSETISQAAMLLTLIQGGILFGAILGAFGILRAHSKLASLGAIILLVESVPLLFDGLFIFTILAAGFFLWASRLKEVHVRPSDSNSFSLAKKE